MEIYERDEWMCQLCGAEIEKTLVWPNPWSKTLDHTKAVTKQGTHDADNLRAAPWLCNLQKGNR